MWNGLHIVVSTTVSPGYHRQQAMSVRSAASGIYWLAVCHQLGQFDEHSVGKDGCVTIAETGTSQQSVRSEVRDIMKERGSESSKERGERGRRYVVCDTRTMLCSHVAVGLVDFRLLVDLS